MNKSTYTFLMEVIKAGAGAGAIRIKAGAGVIRTGAFILLYTLAHVI